MELLNFARERTKVTLLNYLYGMISVSQKIKVASSHLLRSQMELDVEDYGLKGIGDLCNRILARYAEFSVPDTAQLAMDDTLYKNIPPLQFSLSKTGESFANYANNLGNARNVKVAALCRYYFESYVNLPRGKRECFIFHDDLNKLLNAIEKHVNVTLNYRGEVKNVSPCFLAFSPSQVRAYVVVCDGDTSKLVPTRFHSLRLCHIRGVAADLESKAYHCENFDLSHQADLYREHFDPFLCYGQNVKVRFTEKGAERYNKLTTNRPKVLSADEFSENAANAANAMNKLSKIPVKMDCVEVNGAGDYTFECSEKLAKIYFPQFLDEAEILEPRELRLWFKEEFERAAKVYSWR